MMSGEQALSQNIGEKVIKYKGERKKKAFFGGEKLIIYFIDLEMIIFQKILLLVQKIE